MVYLDVKGYFIRTQKYIQADTMHNLYVFSNHGALKAKTLINWAHHDELHKHTDRLVMKN